MQHDELIGTVQHRARLSSRGDAERSVRAVLETLSDRLQGGEAKDLAAQLPGELGLHLTRDQERAESSERFDLDGFYRRVSDREGTEYPDAIFHTRAVVSVLEEAVSPGEMSQVRQQLGEAFAPLFEFEGDGAAG